MHRQHAYVASSNERDEGLYTYDVDVSSDDLDVRRTGVTPLEDSPSFLTAHLTGKCLYAVHEVERGAVTALGRSSDGSLRRLNREETGGAGPCHCSVHPSGDYLLVAHYQDGTVSVLPLRDDGRLEPPTEVVHHTGSGEDPNRQTQPHPHSIRAGPAGNVVYVPDLGTDTIVTYEFEDGTLEQLDRVPIHDGAGPRHLTFHPSGDVVYLINELDSSIAVLEREAETGVLDPLRTYSTLPGDTTVENYPADIHLHPNGDFLYGSNRGHDSIVVFAVGPDGRELTPVDHVETDGEWPRNFALDVSGRALFAENQHSDTVVGFQIDAESGDLVQADHVLEVPAPFCMVCLPADDW